MSFRDGFEGTWRAVLTSRTLVSTMLLAVVLYAFYYPAPYAHESAQRLPVLVIDQEDSSLTREVLRNLSATREVRIIDRVPDMREAQQRMRRGEADGVILLTRGVTRSLLTGAPGGGVGVWVKAAYLLRASAIGEGVSAAIAGAAEDRIGPAARAFGLRAPVRVIQEPLFNASAGYKDYVFPAVASVILQQTLLFGAATFTAGRRERGDPRMSRAEFAGTWAAMTLIGVIGAFFYFGIVFWVQDVPRGGNVPALLLTVPLFAAAVAALGLFLGTLFDRAERATEVLVPTSVVLFFLTGSAWPLDQMPRWLATLSHLVPSTLAVHIFVPLNQMGARLSDVIGNVVLMAVLVVVYGLCAAWRMTGRRHRGSPAQSVRFERSGET
ncbi:ABC transporter permease [Sphingomonas sp. RB3P16]|uniref:ABC transporter permease n=1 Tax=Parasphingomonas frigoris TaxID=3096163 RepID=UPI002FC63282